MATAGLIFFWQGGVNVSQTVSATTTTTASVVKQAGKPFSITVATTVSFLKACTKPIAITVTSTVSAIKAITLGTISLTVSSAASVVKQAGKIVSTVVSAVAALIRDVYITSTQILQLPINCVLAGQQLFRDRYRENETVPMRQSETPILTKGRGGRISSKAPSFTIKTDKKGYD